MKRRFILPLILFAIALISFLFFFNLNRKTYTVEGQILGFSDNDSTIYINHEEIPGYMEAMSMPFRVQDPKALEGLKIGDAIRFAFHITPEASWIDDIRLISDSLLTLSATPSRFLDAHSTGVEIIKEGEQVPAFTFTDQQGRAFTQSNLEGKYTLMTFIYTTCPVPDFCPRMSQNFDVISASLTEAELEQIQLVSVSFDPRQDTPSVLKAYEQKHKQRGNWFFITGDSVQTKALTAKFGIFTTVATDQIIHNLQTAVIGPDAKVLLLQSGNKWKPETLLEQLRRLIKEKKIS